MKVAIYARVSTKKDQTNENQFIELRRWADASGYTIYKEYQDQASGGRSDRTEFQQMFIDAHQRKFDIVLFWSLDRFSRQGVRETINYLEQLESYGVHFKSYTEQYLDSTGIFKDVIIALLATLAKQEKIRLGERVKAGMARAREDGMVFGRPVLKISNDIKRLAEAGMSDRAIGRELGISHRSVSKYK